MQVEISAHTVKHVTFATGLHVRIPFRDLVQRETALWQPEIMQNGRKSVLTWIPSASRNR